MPSRLTEMNNTELDTFTKNLLLKAKPEVSADFEEKIMQIISTKKQSSSSFNIFYIFSLSSILIISFVGFYLFSYSGLTIYISPSKPIGSFFELDFLRTLSQFNLYIIAAIAIVLFYFYFLDILLQDYFTNNTFKISKLLNAGN